MSQLSVDGAGFACEASEGGRGEFLEEGELLGVFAREVSEPIEAEAVCAGFPVSFELFCFAEEVVAFVACDPDEGLVGCGDGHFVPEVFEASSASEVFAGANGPGEGEGEGELFVNGGDGEEVIVSAVAGEELILAAMAFEVEAEGVGVEGGEPAADPVGGESEVGGVEEFFHGAQMALWRMIRAGQGAKKLVTVPYFFFRGRKRPRVRSRVARPGEPER